MNTIVVVPEGLATDAQGSFFVSDYYAAALDRALQISRPGDKIYLAPANSFGAHQEEDHFGRQYLLDKGCLADIELIDDHIARTGYLDTLDNARYLKKHLGEKREWPTDAVILICNKPHAFRSWLMFRYCGFRIQKLLTTTPVQRSGRKMVKRLWFYDVRFVQYFYEAAAIVHNTCRFLITNLNPE